MDPQLRRKWETILNEHPDEAARERAREVLSAAGPSEETQELAQGISDVRRPMSRLDLAKMQAQPETAQAPPGGGVLDTINQMVNPLHPANQAAYRRWDQAAEGVVPGLKAGVTRAFDRFSAGYLPKLADALGTSSRAEREGAYAESPTATDIGGGIGLGASALAGPGRMVGGGVAGLLPRATSGLGRAATGVAAGAGTGALMEGMEAEGIDDPEGIPQRTLVGGIAGAAGGLLGEAAAGARGLIQRASPWVRRYAEASDTGLLPAARALPRGRRGVQRASELARDDILTADEAMTREAQQAYQGAVESALQRPVNMTPIREQVLRTGVASRPLSAGDVGAPTPVVRRGQRVLEDLRNQPTVEDALQVRRGLDEDAAFGAQAPTPEQLAARQMRAGVRQGVREASPEVAAADDAFANFRRGQERRNDIMFRSEGGGRAVDLSDEALEAMPAGMRQAMRVGDEMKAAAMLERLGDDSVEALRLEPYLDELAAQSPAFAQALERLMAKKSLEATRLLTLSPQVRTNLSPATTNIPGVGTTAQMLSQYGRGTGRLLDQSLRAPATLRQAPALVPLTLLDIYRQRQE